MNEAVGKITKSNQSEVIQQHGDVIADRLQQMQSTNQRKTSEEYEKMKEERDSANKQVIKRAFFTSPIIFERRDFYDARAVIIKTG